MPKMEALEARTNAELIAIILRLEEQVARLEKRITDLEADNAKLRKNSSNSSKPPSSDIVKPPKTKPKGKRKKERRKIGGQKGHPKHERQPFAVEDLRGCLISLFTLIRWNHVQRMSNRLSARMKDER